MVISFQEIACMVAWLLPRQLGWNFRKKKQKTVPVRVLGTPTSDV